MSAKTNFVFTLILKLSLLILAQSQHCPKKYLRFSKEHSYCQPRNSSCDIFETNVTPEDIRVILKEHNELRGKIATGQEKGFPEACNMLEMVWDPELSSVVQKRCEECIYAHDCNECRRVPNFPVGQNIAFMMTLGYGPKGFSIPTKRNWKKIIHDFYDEVKVYDCKQLSSFKPSPHASGPDAYGHFTQLVWAKSWRIGCGFVAFNVSDGYKQLYMCNYGPAGNIKSQPLYIPGEICSGCPINSYCNQSCPETEFPGLCKMLNVDEAPIYDCPEDSLFHCDFRTDCTISKEGDWNIKKTLSGSHMEVIVPPGKSSSFMFDGLIKPETCFCLKVQYCAGPLLDGQKSDYTIELITFALSPNVPRKTVLQPSPPGNNFYTLKLNLNWDDLTIIGFIFSVPVSGPDQYLAIKEVTATEGPCS